MGRRVYAIIPVKKPSNSKSRLSGILGLDERVKLTLLMFEDLLSALSSSKLLNGIVVVSPSDRVLKLATDWGCYTVKEGWSEIGLNKAIKLGVKFSERLEAKATLIVLADIPLIKPRDVDKIVSMGLGLEEPYMVISPSKQGGTNVLVISLPSPIEFKFGPGSFKAHLAQAQKLGLNRLVYVHERTGLDIDNEDDVRLFLSLGNCERSWRYLRSKLLSMKTQP